MTTIRQFEVMDLFKFNSVNLKAEFDTLEFKLYLLYYINYPDYFMVAQHHSGVIMGYIMGQQEGSLQRDNLHVLITLYNIADLYLGRNLSETLILHLENFAMGTRCRYIHIFISLTNKVVYRIHRSLGYVRHALVRDYFTTENGTASAYEMRKTFADLIRTQPTWAQIAMIVEENLERLQNQIPESDEELSDEELSGEDESDEDQSGEDQPGEDESGEDQENLAVQNEDQENVAVENEDVPTKKMKQD